MNENVTFLIGNEKKFLIYKNNISSYYVIE